MDDQNRTWSETVNVTKWFNLVEMVASTPPENKISEPVKQCKGQMQYTGNAVLNNTPMSSESAVCYQCLDIGCSSGTHDSYCCSHRIAKSTQACLWRTLLRIGYSAEKVVDLAVAKRHRLADNRSMPIIFE